MTVFNLPAALAAASNSSFVREILFVDPGVDDLETILGTLRPGVEPVVLDGVRPVARQIAAALAGREIGVVHVIAHGAPGRVSFAAGDWTTAGIDAGAADFAAIGDALGADGEIRLWSCDTGAGAAGAAFVERLARATGSGIAAATARVGAGALGGAWELSAASAGAVLPPLTAAGVAAYAGVLVNLTWTGAVSTDWNNPGNWSPGTVPGAGDGVIINAGTTNLPTLTANTATLGSLLMNGTAY